jgi:hypothetical protein
MNTYFRSLYYGIAAALVFIGALGFAIDSSQWGMSVWLIIIGVVMARLTYGMRNRE